MSEHAPDGERLVELANSDPDQGLEAARRLLATDPEPHRRSEAWRAVAIAQRNLGNLDQARSSLAEARTAAQQAGSDRLVALATMSDALILSKTGRSDEALGQLDAAETGLDGLELAELQFQRALVLNDVPDFVRARSDFTDALKVFRRHERGIWQGDALLGRAIALGSMGELALADRDCVMAAELFEAEDDQVGVGMAVHNAAWIAGLGGEAIKAVVEHDRATTVLEAAGFPTELIHADRCEALISVGLYREAVDLAAIGAAAQDRSGNVLEAADQRMALAAALMRTGQTAEARAEVALALDAFAGQGQRLQALRAEALLAALDLADGHDAAPVVERAHVIAEECLAAGNTEYEGEARLLEARAAIAIDQPAIAATALEAHARRHRPFSQEVERIRLQAVLHRNAGEPGRALRAARRGIRLVHDIQRSVDPVEVRATMSEHVSAIRSLGLAVLTADGRMRDALQLAEQANLAVIDGPRSPTPGRALIEHRALAKSIAEAEHELRNTSRLHRRRRELEREVRRERLARSKEQPTLATRLRNDVTVRRYATVDAAVWAFDLQAGRVTGSRLAPLHDVEEAIRELLFLVRRAFRNGPEAADRIDLAGIAEAADRLDNLLGTPGTLGATGRTGAASAPELTIVLGEDLPTFPLGLLPSLHGRRWVLALRATSGPERAEATDGGTLGVCGPNLVHAQAEIDAIAAITTGTPTTGTPTTGTASAGTAPIQTITATEATCSRVLEAMNATSVAHIVAHSSVNTENPMFSTIELSDGPLYLHELESLTKPPNTVVLASCSSARSVTVGVTTLGFTQAMLSAGINAVVGTALDIPDDADTVLVMASLHAVGATNPSTRGRDLATEPAACVAAVADDPGLTDRQRLIARCLVPAVSEPQP